MQDKYPSIIGKDLGLVTGGNGGFVVQGIFLYKPTNDLVPDFSKGENHMINCILASSEYIKIPYKPVRQIFVNEESVWKNRNSFNLELLGINPFEQSYSGRGDVKIEFNNITGLDIMVKNLLDNNMGFVRL